MSTATLVGTEVRLTLDDAVMEGEPSWQGA